MQMKTIEEIKRFHEARLLALEDVVSVGIGLDEEGNAAIIVGLARQNIRTQAHIPGKLGNFPVVVRVSGQIKSQ